MSDARPAAWLAGYQCLQAADDLLRKHGDSAVEMHDMLVTRAAAYARLAQADQSVGAAVGTYFEQQDKASKRSAFKEALDKKRGVTDEQRSEGTGADGAVHSDPGGDQDRGPDGVVHRVRDTGGYAGPAAGGVFGGSDHDQGPGDPADGVE